MKLYIKYMVCPRCILLIEWERNALNLPAQHIDLGIAELEGPLSEEQVSPMAVRIVPLGCEMLKNSQSRQVGAIKNIRIKSLQAEKLEPYFSVKKYLSAFVCRDYSYLSKLFSEMEGMTIAHYSILLKLEKVKEWLTYGEPTLNEITWNVGYSTVPHLSAQFKRVLGTAVRDFKVAYATKRKAIDQIGFADKI